MAFNAELREEKPMGTNPKDTQAKKQEKEKKEKKLDQALKETFPASDPVARETLVTGTRAKKPELPKD